MPSTFSRQRGLSLVELLIAMTIMLIVIAAVLAIYASSRQTTRTQFALSRMTETTSYFHEMLARDLRHVGFVGCPSVGESSRGSINNIDHSVRLTSGRNAYSRSRANFVRVVAPVAADYPADRRPTQGTNVIEVLSTTRGGSVLTEEMNTPNSVATPIKLKANLGFAANGNISPPAEVLISDCKDAEVFLVDSVTQGAGGYLMRTVNPLVSAFSVDARVYPVVRVHYFVGIYSGVNGASSQGTQVIYRAETNPVTGLFLRPEPLVFNVSNAGIQAEIDTNGDFNADESQPWTTSIDTTRAVGMRFTYTVNESRVNQAGQLVNTGGGSERISRTYSPVFTIRGRSI